MSTRKINADLSRVKGKTDRYFSKCVSIGRAGELMRAPVMAQLRTVQSECPFEYVRFHGIFHEEMNIVHRDADGKLYFCFNYADMLFDMLLENGLRPVCELGLMPDTMASEKKYVFWWKMNISMPHDISEWASLIRAFISHVTERYGESEIKKWYFEIWNEPNHKNFFTEYTSPEAYFTLYDAAAREIKRVCPEYRVGGPATAGMQWIQELIDHCRAENVPLDFITSHSYGVKGDFDEDGTAITVMKKIDKVSEEVRVHGENCMKQGLPLIVTEWSASYSPTDPVHDHYFSAPYLLRAVKRCEGHAAMLSYWVFSDIFEENSPPTEPFHGGFGFINAESVPKPIFHAYAFLSRLGDTELSCDDGDAYVCKSGTGVQILFWNISLPEGGVNNKKYFSADVPCESAGKTLITLEGLMPNRAYTVRRRTVGKGSGDPLTLYKTGAFGKLTTREQARALTEASKPKLTVFTAVSDESGEIEFYADQLENQADLIEIDFA